MNAQQTKYAPELIENLKQFGQVSIDASLADFTSFKTGGPADILIQPRSCSAVQDVIRFLKEQDVPLTVIGGGSNLLVGDRGVRGVVVCLSEKGPCCTRIFVDEEGLIYADASVSKERFISFAVKNGYDGIQFMVGIPGAIGGGIRMNAGTFMGSFVDVLRKVSLIDGEGEPRDVDVSVDMSDYRSMNLGNYRAITGGFFKLPFSKNSDDVAREVEEILKDRESKHPLEYPSAGSVFKNPPGHSSWQLIDQSGLKGCRVGGAMVSEKHTNFVINYDGAVSADIRSLIEMIQETVYRKYRINLETEIKMLGEF